MYENKLIPPAENSTAPDTTVDPMVFSNFVLPLRSTEKPSPAPEHNSTSHELDFLAINNSLKVTPKIDAPWLHQGGAAPARYERVSPDLSKFENNGTKWHEATFKPDTPRTELKTGEDAIKEYVKDIQKLSFATIRDKDTEFELRSLLKDTSLSATIACYDVPQPVWSSVAGKLKHVLEFRTKTGEWTLDVDHSSGEATAHRLNARTGKMEPVPVGPVMEHVIMTMRSAMAIKCFRDGDIDSGRAQLRDLLQDGAKAGAQERLKAIINREADLIYKPVRLRAISREDFNKILSETQRTLRVPQKR